MRNIIIIALLGGTAASIVTWISLRRALWRDGREPDLTLDERAEARRLMRLEP